MKKQALFVLGKGNAELIYGPDEQADITRLVDVLGPPLTAETVGSHPDLLAQTDVIFSGWGCPTMDAAFLAKAPRLAAVFYGSGSVRGLVTDAFWDRNIVICGAWGANAVTVAEFTFAEIILSLKRGWYFMRRVRAERRWLRESVPGTYGSTVGLISLGMVGRAVAERLKTMDVKVLAYDPYAKPEVAAALNLELCPLTEVFRRADVVSCHAPNLPETQGLITGEHFAAMKPNATFINTARGAVIKEDELIAVLQQRPDLYAVLDVTHPHEPPQPDSPLYDLPNVVLTPHIAGVMDHECWRMGRCMVQELERWLQGAPLRWRITREMLPRLA